MVVIKVVGCVVTVVSTLTQSYVNRAAGVRLVAEIGLVAERNAEIYSNLSSDHIFRPAEPYLEFLREFGCRLTSLCYLFQRLSVCGDLTL